MAPQKRSLPRHSRTAAAPHVWQRLPSHARSIPVPRCHLIYKKSTRSCWHGGGRSVLGRVARTPHRGSRATPALPPQPRSSRRRPWGLHEAAAAPSPAARGSGRVRGSLSARRPRRSIHGTQSIILDCTCMVTLCW